MIEVGRRVTNPTMANSPASVPHTEFHDDPETHLLHGLRFEDPKQPEQDDSPRVCQIDHLVDLNSLITGHQPTSYQTDINEAELSL